MNSSILYLEKGNRSTIIHYANHIIEEQPYNIERYLNMLCLNELTTLEGRIEAIKNKFNLIKNVPIYINPHLVLFTIKCTKTIDNIYVNSIYIKSIIKNEKICRIIFYDNQEININSTYSTLKTKYEKCIKIKNQICQSL